MNKTNIYPAFIAFLALTLLLTACKESKDHPDNMMNLPPLKEQFSEYFDIGNIFNPGDTGGGRINNQRLIRHYNILTAENDMKPNQINRSRGVYDFLRADNMVNAARTSGFKVLGHTLLWHTQIPQWQVNLRTDNTSKENALQYMKDYITAVVSHFKGRVYAWDVLNEAFPDGNFTEDLDWKNVMRSGTQGNPWYMKIGSDFVYEAFLAARSADPDAILYYNDYNLNLRGKALMVHNMVRDVNAKYALEYPGSGLLIQGIGMQSHHNTNVSAASIRASFDLFRPLGVVIAISELDILSQNFGDFSNRVPPTEQGKARAADLYGEFFTVFLENADIIERVTFWGVYDEQSWRASGLPLIFEGRAKSRAKPAYFKIIEALEAFQGF